VARAAAVAGVCATGHCSVGNASAATTPVPATPPRADSIISAINKISLTDQTLMYPSNAIAEERAVQWLIDLDLNTTANNQLLLLLLLHHQQCVTKSDSLSST
jgi:hypothetical protein